jgi:hypothetical protein
MSSGAGDRQIVECISRGLGFGMPNRWSGEDAVHLPPSNILKGQGKRIQRIRRKKT